MAKKHGKLQKGSQLIWLICDDGGGNTHYALPYCGGDTRQDAWDALIRRGMGRASAKEIKEWKVVGYFAKRFRLVEYEKGKK